MSEDAGVPEISPSEVKRSIDEDNAPVLIDCRTPQEFEAAKIAGTVLLPMQELPQRIGELEPYKNRQVVVLCHHGQRSLQVAALLRQQGYAASSMAGGIDAWSREIDPAVPRY